MEDSRLIVGAATDPGPVREGNEDAVYHEIVQTPTADELLVLAVADGVGGYQRGEVASSMAIDALRERFTTAESDDVVILLKQAFRQANEQIYAGGSVDGEHNMMGTTLVAGIVKGMDLAIGNIGDSRAYLVRAKNLNQITHDHSLVAEQVAMGAMTQDEARGSQHKNIITRALGHRQRVDVDIFELTLLPDDRLLLSTDGLHDHLSDDEMTSILLSMQPEDAAKELVDRAIRAGSTDNVTALCVWAAPISILDAPAEEPVADSRMNLVLTILVVLGLLIFVAIIGYVVFVT